MPTIYLDVVWMENFLMDLWILFLTGWLGKWKVPMWRLLLGAASSACLSLVVFIPVFGDPFSSWWGKALMSVLIVRITFPWRDVRMGCKQLALFYLSTFMTGGVVLAASFFTSSNLGNLQIVNDSFTWQMNLGVAGLFGSLPLVYLCFDQLLRIKNRRVHLQNRVPVHIRVADQEITVQAIVDTGNSLQDPFQHDPVSIAVAKAVLGILPTSIRELYETSKDPVLQLGNIRIEPEFEARIRIIPYRGVGGSSGMLLAFHPDEWWVSQGDDILPLQGLIGLQVGELCAQNTYQMILHPDAASNDADQNKSPVSVWKGANLA